MSYLYLTADQLGTETGGGSVTANEREALASLGDVRTISRQELSAADSGRLAEPWKWDSLAYAMVGRGIKLCHVYSGTFSSTVAKFKSFGTKVVYTIAAHRVADSKAAFENLGLSYDFPHLTDREQWRRYSVGYFAADVIVCPSTHSAKVVQEQAEDLWVPCPPIEVIPHGCHLPEKIVTSPASNVFRVGYCGAYGPDKGVRYLLEAWRELNYKDAVLILAGRDSTSNFAGQLIRAFGGGNIQVAGWQQSMTDFYSSLYLYVQPSATEGFGMEVLEAMANWRPVLCSDHAGAKDLVDGSYVFRACDVNNICEHIEFVRRQCNTETISKWNRETAELHTWDAIRQRYVTLWRSLL